MPSYITPINIALALGLLGSAFFIASCFSVIRSRILIFGLISSVILIASYYAKGDFSTSFLVLVALVRNVLFLMVGQSTVGRRLVWLIVTGVTLALFALLNHGYTIGVYSYFPLAGTFLMLFGFAFGGVRTLKVMTILNGLLWLVYEYTSGAYTAMIGEGVAILFAGLALYRLGHRYSEISD